MIVFYSVFCFAFAYDNNVHVCIMNLKEKITPFFQLKNYDNYVNYTVQHYIDICYIYTGRSLSVRQ